MKLLFKYITYISRIIKRYNVWNKDKKFDSIKCGIFKLKFSLYSLDFSLKSKNQELIHKLFLMNEKTKTVKKKIQKIVSKLK